MKEQTPPPIDWDPGPARGFVARLVGPGATSAELFLQFGFAFTMAAAVLFLALFQGWEWSALQLAVVVVLAFDIAGGIATNATAAGKRWNHRRGRSKADHLIFIAIHGIHLALLAIAFYPNANELAVVGYGYLMGAAVAQLWAPLYLRRAIALGEFSIGVLLSLYVIQSPDRLEWFLPAMLLKLLVAYLPPEAPFSACVPNPSKG